MARWRRPRWAGKKTGKNPTDRGKLGVKRSVLTDATGLPLGVAIAGANVHDQKLVVETLSSIPVQRPKPQPRKRQHLCADKGYDAKAVRTAAKRRRYIVHIPRKGEDAARSHRRKGRARRWVVERTHSWMNRARRLLVRWEKKAANYLGFLHLQFALTAWKAAGVLG
jgi:transposase